MQHLRHFLACIFQSWQRRRLARRQRQLDELQIVEQQRQWLRSLEQTTHEADLSAGYNQGHFNTMQ